jgi:hypothetical protein
MRDAASPSKRDAGGHLVQLRRLRAAWAGCRVTWVTTDPAFAASIRDQAARGGEPAPAVRAVAEGNRWNKIALVRQMLGVAAAVIAVRPHVILTTGAAPGYFAIRFGKLIGARTVWIDSVANAEELSLSGREAGRHADLFLTQWPHLADPAKGGPICLGAVI